MSETINSSCIITGPLPSEGIYTSQPSGAGTFKGCWNDGSSYVHLPGFDLQRFFERLQHLDHDLLKLGRLHERPTTQQGQKTGRKEIFKRGKYIFTEPFCPRDDLLTRK